MASVTLKQIQKTYNQTQNVIASVDLHIQDGEFVVFVGPSGCGKSTLLRMIAGLEDISNGELYIGDQLANDLPASQRGVSMVFQSYALYPHMTVAQNMGFALKMAGMSKSEVTSKVERAADILHMGDLLQRKPKELSGGQRQRVAIGRAIVRQPEVFLFDEPLSNLDAALRQNMRIELAKLHRQLGSTMIYVTHDQVEAMTLADRIVLFNQGVIQQVGKPLELYDSPANLFVAGFLGSPKMNILPVQLTAVEQDQSQVRFQNLYFNTQADCTDDARDNEIDAAAHLGIRPEHIQLLTQTDEAIKTAEQSPNTVAVTITMIEQLGDQVLVYFDLDATAQNLCVKLQQTARQNSAQLQVDQVVFLRFPPEHCLLFDAQGNAFPRISTPCKA